MEWLGYGICDRVRRYEMLRIYIIGKLCFFLCDLLAVKQRILQSTETPARLCAVQETRLFLM